ncbi:hypothetical protein LguiB_035799 [Lonicera macranthoides]
MSLEANSEETQMSLSQQHTSSDDDKPKAVVSGQNEIVAQENSQSKENGPTNSNHDQTKGESSSSSSSSLSTSAFIEQEAGTFKEHSGLISHLSESENKALMELRSKLTEAILMNMLLVNRKPNGQEPKSLLAEESARNARVNKEKEQQQQENPRNGESEDKGKSKQSDEEQEKIREIAEAKTVEIDENISLWGVPLLPSKGDKGTDIILLKFLRAREFKVTEAYEMLRNTLQWRKEFKMDSILEEEFGTEYDSVAYTNGEDREGHPVCYNVYGTFADDEMYNKTFGTEEGRQKFLRWRLGLMEKQIQKLYFKPGGVSSLLQINDLNNAPGPSKKDLRLATKQVVQLLQDNYPEFVTRNIFVNVPVWYYAFNALLSPFLTQRTKSKFIFSRPSRVTETLLQYIAAEEIPFQYGGFKRDNDPHFSTKDGVSEISIKVASSETIEIPAPEVGSTLVWDVVVLGWEVNYKEEFVPTDEESYTLIVKKGRKMGWQEGSLRNTFKNKEAGKVVITIDNASFKRKRAIYRYKPKTNSSSSSF